MGLPGPSNLCSAESIAKWTKWKENSCQPNFRKNVFPVNGCGPYHRSTAASGVTENACSPSIDGSVGYLSTPVKSDFSHVNHKNHDTISMAVIDNVGRIAVGISTNGATFKIPGRVGDGPIAGSSAYADHEVGAMVQLEMVISDVLSSLVMLLILFRINSLFSCVWEAKFQIQCNGHEK